MTATTWIQTHGSIVGQLHTDGTVSNLTRNVIWQAQSIEDEWVWVTPTIAADAVRYAKVWNRGEGERTFWLIEPRETGRERYLYRESYDDLWTYCPECSCPEGDAVIVGLPRAHFYPLPEDEDPTTWEHPTTPEEAARLEHERKNPPPPPF